MRRRPHLDPLDGRDPRQLASVLLGPEGRPLMRPAPLGLEPGERFARALRAQGARLRRARGRLGVERSLAEASVVAMGRIPYASNAVFLLELDARAPGGEEPLRAVYKPAAGERPLWDFPARTLHFREVATRLVDAALGFDLVPPTVLRDGPHGPGSVQLLVDVARRRVAAAEKAAIEDRLGAVAALDALINNADRKSAHLLVDRGGGLRCIDHGLTFLPYPRQRTVLLGLGGTELPGEVATAVAALEETSARRDGLVRALTDLLAPDEVDAFAGRLRELAADPVYPMLDAWDGRPFEWW